LVHGRRALVCSHSQVTTPSAPNDAFFNFGIRVYHGFASQMVSVAGTVREEALRQIEKAEGSEHNSSRGKHAFSKARASNHAVCAPIIRHNATVLPDR
jgi:hypothetical protein